jgi:hypothetical protein
MPPSILPSAQPSAAPAVEPAAEPTAEPVAIPLATLAAIPARDADLPANDTAVEPAAAPAAEPAAEPVPEPAPEPTVEPTAEVLAAIRRAVASGHLDEADRLLAAERARLTAAGPAAALDLAELTGLAGDHAAASGRLGGARWLWRLALQRFGAANAMTSPAARAVADRLRLADQ